MVVYKQIEKVQWKSVCVLAQVSNELAKLREATVGMSSKFVKKIRAIPIIVSC